MAYVKNIWVDQDVERPKTYEVTNNQDGSITLTDSFGLVTELGTPVNEVNMNHIEDGIDGCAIRKHNLTETFNLGEWVLGGTGDDEGIYKSLTANNVGNAISDDTKWEEVELGGGSDLNLYTTNCITEIPQDINLTLSNGTLTLKAGSKVYVPNGFEQDGITPKFDEVIIGNDTAVTYGTVFDRLILTYNATSNVCILTRDIHCYSGDTVPSPASGSTRQMWYDTTNNIIKTRSGSGEWSTSISFPIAIVNCIASNTFTINQVFNGFGYIGSTVFALPNVKALAPNGRNADGTLKNTEHTSSSVWTTTLSNNSEFALSVFGTTAQSNNYVESEAEPTNNYTLWYKPSENIMYRKSGTGVVSENGGCFFAYVQTGSSNITRFVSKYDFRALDYNDKPIISGWSMPSNKNIDLTLGSSGTIYTAPANGWVLLSKQSSGSGQRVNLSIIGKNIEVSDWSSGNTQGLAVYLPVAKGDTFIVRYTAGGTLYYFSFIYAQGSESEA